MRTDTKTLIEACRILARDIQSDDGVANAALAEIADRLEELEKDRERLDWVEGLDSDSRLWFELSDALDIRKTVDDLTEKTK